MIIASRLVVGLLVFSAAWAGPALARNCTDSIPATTPDSRYTAHGNGTVTDEQTGLMWKRCSEGQSWDGSGCTGEVVELTWKEALQRTEAVNAGEAGTNQGHSDWRLPNGKELASLVEQRCEWPAINTTMFPNTPSSYWSASPYAKYSGYAWYVSFYDGNVYDDYKDDAHGVRLVRGGQSFAALDNGGAGTQALANFLSENLSDGRFVEGSATKRWTFENGDRPVSGLKAVRTSADTGLGLSQEEVAIGDVAAGEQFTVEVPINPRHGDGPAAKRAEFKLVDGNGNAVAIGNSGNDRFWLEVRTNRAPRFAERQAGSAGAAAGEAVSVPVRATDPDGDGLSYQVEGAGSIQEGAYSATFDQTGVHSVTLVASDGNAEARHQLDVVVTGDQMGQLFGDVSPDIPEYGPIHYLAREGVVIGVPGDTDGERVFSPYRTTTRAEALKMVLEAAKQRGLVELADDYRPLPRLQPEGNRDRVDYTWATPYVLTAEEKGALADADAFRPAAPVSRAWLADIVDAVLGLEVPVVFRDSEGYALDDEAAFDTDAAYASARRTAFFGYMGTLGEAFEPTREVPRKDAAEVVAAILRTPVMDGVSFSDPRIVQWGGESLPAVRPDETLTIAGVEGLEASGFQVDDTNNVVDAPAAAERVDLAAVPGGDRLSGTRRIAQLVDNPLEVQPEAVTSGLTDRRILYVMLQDTASGARSLKRVPFAVARADRDGDGVPDGDDAFPDDAEASADQDGDGIPDSRDEDRDGDGLPDLWEAENGLSPEDPTDPDGDRDGDGWTNQEEYEQGTEADVPTSDLDGDGIPDSLDSDRDGDGMPNAWELGAGLDPDDASDATGDPDGDGRTNVEEYEQGTDPQLADNDGNETGEEEDPATGTGGSPSIEVPGPQTVASNWRLTDLREFDLGGVTASDPEDGRLTPQLVNPIVPPGRHEVEWVVTDSDGNRATARQTVKVLPKVRFAVDQTVGEGGEVTVGVHLNGPAPSYPLEIPYTVGGTAQEADHDAADGTVTLTDGETQGAIRFQVVDDGLNGEGEETVEIRLDQQALLGAIAGASSVHTVTITEANLAPSVELSASQADEAGRRTILATDGPVTVTARVRDPNSGDTHSVTWSGTDNRLVDQDGDDDPRTFVFDPAGLNPGAYRVRAKATEQRSDGRAPKASTTELVVRVPEQPPELGDGDTDGDGRLDSEEGLGDSDGDGIPDFRDRSTDPSVLPLEDRRWMSSEPGLKLAVGNVAIASQGSQVDGTRMTSSEVERGLEELGEPGGDLEREWEAVDGFYDFQIAELGAPGDAASIVVPLPEGQRIPEGARYRKFQPASGWTDFTTTGANALSSAPRRSAGDCPAPDTEAYTEGLTAGDDCLRITIVDGGPNDADGEPNGRITDPGSLVRPASADEGGSDTGDEGGSDTGQQDGASAGNDSDDSSSGGGGCTVATAEQRGGLLLPLMLAVALIGLFARHRARQAL